MIIVAIFEDVWGEDQDNSSSSDKTGNSSDLASGDNTDGSTDLGNSNASDNTDGDEESLDDGAEDDRNSGFGPLI